MVGVETGPGSAATGEEGVVDGCAESVGAGRGAPAAAGADAHAACSMTMAKTASGRKHTQREDVTLAGMLNSGMCPPITCAGILAGAPGRGKSLRVSAVARQVKTSGLWLLSHSSDLVKDCRLDAFGLGLIQGL